MLRATVDLMEGIKQSFNSEPPERSSRRSFSTKAPALVTPSKLASRCPVLTTASVAPTPASLARRASIQSPPKYVHASFKGRYHVLGRYRHAAARQPTFLDLFDCPDHRSCSLSPLTRPCLSGTEIPLAASDAEMPKSAISVAVPKPSPNRNPSGYMCQLRPRPPPADLYESSTASGYEEAGMVLREWRKFGGW